MLMLKKIIAVLVTLVVIWKGVGVYNTIVEQEEAVDKAWAQVESNLQRKVDLLPNLVKSVKGYMQHEDEVLTKITQIRSEALSAFKESGDELKKVKKLTDVDQKLTGVLGRFFAISENYPQLRSSEQFLQLQAQIEGSENRINISRMNYNEAVGTYNALIRKVPYLFFAKLQGLTPKEYFKADQKAYKNYEVNL